MPEVGYPLDPNEEISGFYNPFQPEETTEIAELRERVKDEITDEIISKYGGPQRCFERFLIARNYDLNKSEKMLRSCLKIREMYGLDSEKSTEELEAQKALFAKIDEYWPIRYWGFTKNNNLIILGKLRDIKPKEFISKFSEEQIKEFYFNFMEKVLTLQNYANSPPNRSESETKWKGNVEIYDFGGVGRSQVQMQGLMVLRRVLGLGQGNYPECLFQTFLINVPWFFSAAWKVISIVLNKRTIAKVHISSGNCMKQISELMGSREAAEELLSRKS